MIETEDVVARLRRTETRKSYVATNRTAPIIVSDYDAPINPDGPEAADTIERLREENARLKDPTPEMIEAGIRALDDCVDYDWDSGGDGEGHNEYVNIRSDAAAIVYRAMIRAALNQQ